MKTPESLVPSLDLCKEFARVCEEKGVEIPETYFYYHNGKILANWEMRGRTVSEENLPVAMPTASEIGEWLPFVIESVGEHYYLTIDKAREYWNTNYEDPYGITLFIDFGSITGERQQDSLLSMLTYLIDQGLVTKLK